MSMKLYMIDIGTRHFDFMVVSETKEGAIKAFQAGWKEHMRQTGALSIKDNFLDDLAANPREISTDTFYRDYDTIKQEK